MTKSYFEQKYRILSHCAILVERDGTKITRDRLNSSGILASILYYFRFVSLYRDGREVEMFRLKSKVLDKPALYSIAKSITLKSLSINVISTLLLLYSTYITILLLFFFLLLILLVNYFDYT